MLVVEDAARLLEILTRRLRQEGYGVDGAGSGEAAVRLASAVPYDAIVLDMRAARRRRLRGLPRASARTGAWSPILMLTARDALRDACAASTKGRTTT